MPIGAARKMLFILFSPARSVSVKFSQARSINRFGSVSVVMSWLTLRMASSTCLR